MAVRNGAGDVEIVRGPFHEGDRKSGYPILCDACGCEVEPEEDES